MAPETQSAVLPRRSIIHKTGKAVLALLLVAIGLACAGAAYQVIGTWRDADHFHQQGHSVQAGSVKLNIDCYGQGNPIVILESGLTVPALGWMKVQPEVAKFTRVCSYDRAGYGWSDPGPEPRTMSEISKELKVVLDAAGEKGPFVLVGHSLGGFIVRVFTHLYPGEVAGVVLVDASHEDEDDRINALLPEALKMQEKKKDEWDAKVNRVMTPIRVYLGLQRLELAMGWSGSSHLSKEQRQELSYLRQQSKARKAIVSESAAWPHGVAEVRSAGGFGDRPLIVLTAGKPYDPDPLLTKEQMDRQSDMWIHDLQAQEARLSTHGRQIVVPDSSHMIPYERPDTIISAIHEVCSTVRDSDYQ